MKENADKYVDELSRKVIGKSSLESPSFDFTTHVMAKVQSVSESKVTTYKPLISKTVWLIIVLFATSGIAYILSGNQTESHWLQKLNVSNNLTIPNVIPDLDVSQTTLYVFVLFAIMFSIQIPILKRQLDKRFD